MGISSHTGMNARETVQDYLENTDKACVKDIAENTDYAKTSVQNALRDLRLRDKVYRTNGPDGRKTYYRIRGSNQVILDEIREMRRDIQLLKEAVQR